MARAVPAVSRALDVLELFLDRGTLSAPDIAERLDLPRTTVHELVNTLVDRSYLIATEGSPIRYRLGMRLFVLGNRFAESLDIAREAQSVADAVAAACDETVQVAILDGSHVVSIATADSTHPVRMVAPLGRRVPAHCAAAGTVLLAGMSPEAIDARYPMGTALPSLTRHSITSPARLRDRLAEIRATGVAYEDCEANDAVRGVAAPVHDHTGSVVAGLAICVPTVRWTDPADRQWESLVRDGAARLSALLGHRNG